MHYISNIKIENYKSIIDGNFPLEPLTPLVGYNNAGKTNILGAINWVIKKSKLDDVDFYDPKKPVVVTADLSGFTNDVLDALDKSTRSNIDSMMNKEGIIKIRRTQSDPHVTLAKIKDEIYNPDISDWDEDTKKFASALGLFAEPIFVGAMEDATKDVTKYGAGTTIGRIVKKIIEPHTSKLADDVAGKLKDISEQLSADSAKKEKLFADLDSQIEDELKYFFPEGVRAKTHVPMPEFSEILENTTIRISEDGYSNSESRDVISFGHGTQRSVQMALIKRLSESNKDVASNTKRTLLLVDEPELYLHPQAIELVRASLRKLSEQNYQVVFTTHSSNMITRSNVPNTLMIRKNIKEGTTTYPRISDKVKDVIDGQEHQSATLFNLGNSSEILFTEHVVLVEGKTEIKLLPNLFFEETNSTLGSNKIGLIALNGSGNILKAMKVLKSVGIPTKAIVDLDFAFKVKLADEEYFSSDFNSAIDDFNNAIEECKKILKDIQPKDAWKLDGDGLPLKGNGFSAADGYAMMAKQKKAKNHVNKIHDLLSEESIWCWKFGTIENHLELDEKNEAAQSKFVKDIKDEKFRKAISGYQAIPELFFWLKKDET